MRLASTRPVSVLVLSAALGVALPAAAQMYKWTDERGVVSYSNTPPPSTANRKVESVEERVSVYSTDEETKRLMSEEKRREPKPAAPSLGRQLDAERARGARANAQAARQASDYQRCVEQRRVDCDSLRGNPSDSTAAIDYGSGYGVGDGFVFLPQHVIGSRPVVQPPFAVGASPIPRIGIDNRPPVGISTAPPVGVSPPQPPIGNSAPTPTRPRTGPTR